jgi:lipopolysaccharide transport system ATP-binding protein
MDTDSREWHIGLAGTFDVENYGDLLFPLIAEAELTERLGRIRLHCFSYAAKTAAEWPFPVTSVTELPRLAAGLDGLLIGGGFLVRFDKKVAAGYGPPTPAIHHPTGFWLSPALIALQHGIPLLWNTPGVSYDDLPAWGDPLMDLALSQSAYIAVRDEPSRAALARFVSPDRVAVVPDTAFGIERLLADPPFEFNRLREACGLSGPYIVIQGVRGLDSCYGFLKRHADRLRGYRFLALPIGPVNGDKTAYLDIDLPGLVQLPSWPPPLVMAELIRQAAAVIGPSFHLATTALTAGVPLFTPANFTQGKFPGLVGFEGVYPLPREDEADPGAFLARLGKGPVSPQVGVAVERLGGHWNRVAETLRAGRTDTAAAVGRFWQSLPGVLEEAAVRRDAAVAALEAQIQVRERIGELSRLVALARTEIAKRDLQIAEFRTSTSWKISAPVRFVGRLLGR